MHMRIKWGLCTLHHGIQISMEAILACHPARSTEWLDCHPKSCELWRIHTGPIAIGTVSLLSIHVFLTPPQTICRSQSTDQSRETNASPMCVLWDLQIFSGSAYHLEQPHAHWLNLLLYFPIDFGVIFNSFFRWELLKGRRSRTFDL